MSLIISKVFTYDEDAGNYIQRVEGASGDNQVLEPAVRQAINNFVIGCKQDGIWTAIKASCILAGARTLNGALQPLVGAAPTNNNFVSGDYNRKTGLKGNGSNKALNSNRSNSADPQNNKHIAIYETQANVSAGQFPIYIGVENADGSQATCIQIGGSGDNNKYGRINTNAYPNVGNARSTLGFHGASRNNATNSSLVIGGGSVRVSDNASVTPLTRNTAVFASNRSGGFAMYTDARFAFYSIGESLALDLYSARVTALITALGAAIP